MKVSVIIPVYNAEKFVAKAVESALSQSETGEVILIEDCSQDNSLKICKKLDRQYEKVKLYQHSDKKNHGAGVSRNLGIRKAAYDYIAFLDADDYYLPHRFRAEKTIFEKHPDADGVYGASGIRILDGGNSQYLKGAGEEKLIAVEQRVAPEDLLPLFLVRGKWVFHGNTLTLKKKVFEKTGLFNDLELGQDIHMWMKVAAISRLYTGEIQDPVAMYTIHGLNRVGDKAKLRLFRPLIYQSLLTWGIKQDLPRRKLSHIWLRYWTEKYVDVSSAKRVCHLFLNLIKYPWLIREKVFFSVIPILGRHRCFDDIDIC